ncbi:hypothetical protein B0H13DRAFT_1900558 [Mycena leptocephala]|nr:hypothetical protein B0H13DRAFT_1900558 [Mycena leptocephala]
MRANLVPGEMLENEVHTYYLRPPTWPPKLVGHLAFISLSGPGCAKLGLAGWNATPNGGPYPIWRLTDGRIKCCVVFDVVPEGDAISFLTPQTRLLSFSTSSGPIDEFGGSFCLSHSGLQSVPQNSYIPSTLICTGVKKGRILTSRVQHGHAANEQRIAMATLKLEIGNHDTGILSLRALCPFPLLWSVSKGQFSVVCTVEIFPGPVDVGRMSGASKIMVWHLIQRFEFTRSPHSTHEEDWAGVAN